MAKNLLDLRVAHYNLAGRCFRQDNTCWHILNNTFKAALFNSELIEQVLAFLLNLFTVGNIGRNTTDSVDFAFEIVKGKLGREKSAYLTVVSKRFLLQKS